MKIITWNCNMAFRKKYESIIDLKPDLIVIQECEHKTKIKEAFKNIQYNQIIWYGENIHKGVAIISFNDIHIELNKNHDPRYKYVIPILLTVKNKKINLFAVWAMPNKNDKSKNYVGQVWGAISCYKKLLNEDSILVGDFNSNAFWDNKIKNGNHTDVVNYLSDKNISSVYHKLNNVDHGKESEPTFYLVKNIKKPYHLDYCFLSDGMFSSKTKISVGTYHDWIRLSDHTPIIIENVEI